MGDPIVHVEISGREPELLRRFFGELFDWSYDLAEDAAPEISERGEYGVVQSTDGPPLGVGGGSDFAPHAVFYVGVPDVEVAPTRAEQLGGTRVLGPVHRPDGGVVVGQFRDPEGTLIGVAAAAQ
jgi:predicted enzyme related to lactoylglutathione lyase